MAGAIRLTAAERELVRDLLETEAARTVRDGGARKRTATAALAKLEASELPVRKNGLAAQTAVEAFVQVLGNRLVKPPAGAQGVWGAMGNRLRMLGLTRGDCVTIARVAGAAWRGPIKAESLVRQADTLLSGAQSAIPGTPRGPIALGEDDFT